MNRRRFLARFACLPALATIPWLAACGPARPLAVGIHPWIGYETLYLAREFGWLPASVELAEGKTLGDSQSALQAGRIDAACLTLDEVLVARAAGVPLAVALVFDVSAGADVVLARSNVRSLADLAGKRIGLELNALGALMLSRLLAAAGLPASAVTLLDLPPDRQLEAWRKGEVDAVVTYEPTASLLMREGARRLFDSRRIPDTIFDVLAVRTDRARDQRAAVESLVAGHFRALGHLQTNRQDAIYRIAARQKITPEEVQLSLAGVVLPSLDANRGYLASQDTRLPHAAKTLSALMVERRLLAREDDLAGLFSSAWLPRDIT